MNLYTLPCPACGGKKTYYSMLVGSDWSWRCRDCGLDFPREYVFGFELTLKGMMEYHGLDENSEIGGMVGEVHQETDM